MRIIITVSDISKSCKTWCLTDMAFTFGHLKFITLLQAMKVCILPWSWPKPITRCICRTVRKHSIEYKSQFTPAVHVRVPVGKRLPTQSVCRALFTGAWSPKVNENCSCPLVALIFNLMWLLVHSLLCCRARWVKYYTVHCTFAHLYHMYVQLNCHNYARYAMCR